MAKTYAVEVSYTNGRSESYESYDAAVEALTTEYPDAEIGHDGDLSDGGDRTLVWESEEDSVNDDGAKAVASIRKA